MLTLDSPSEDFIAEMQRLREFYALKSVMRYNSTRDTSVHSESVAEHLYGMQVLANYFLPLEDPKGELDPMRIHELILYHELGEIETGDIMFHRKSSEQKQEERRAAERVATRLPESIRVLALERFLEFDAAETPHARFADAIDKVEPIFQLFDPVIGLTLYKNMGVTKDVAIGKKLLATEPYPYMRRFLEAWTERAVALDAFPG